MSVIIKGMKMPNNCGECVLCNAVKDDEYDYEINTYCHATGESLESLDVRGDRCPLVDVPTPHGRLVDADALKATFCAECNHTITCEDCDIDYHIGRLAPTIIEAEE